MTRTVDEEIARCTRDAERVALARVSTGRWQGHRLLIWPAGDSLGDLGAPRLNQRVSLYAEGLLKRGGSGRKVFDVMGEKIEVDVELIGSPSGH